MTTILIQHYAAGDAVAWLSPTGIVDADVVRVGRRKVTVRVFTARGKWEVVKVSPEELRPR